MIGEVVIAVFSASMQRASCSTLNAKQDTYTVAFYTLSVAQPYCASKKH